MKKKNTKKASKTLSKTDKQSPNPTCTGLFRMNARGFGFVIPEDVNAFPLDIFIPKHLTLNAVDGDTVLVKVLPSTKPEKGPEGQIVEVVERSRSHLGGIVEDFCEDKAIVYSPLLGPNKTLLMAKTPIPLSVGDRVIVEILDWGDQDTALFCALTSVLGSISDASLDITAATEEFQIQKDFSKEVLRQAKAFGKKVSEQDKQGRLDFTQEECFTIDPTTAKDFDDALSLSKDAKGIYHLGVHIADVSHYVTPGSPLDVEAKNRANSTYFPGACIPMLPEELSNHLCSLKPNVIRLCSSILMQFDASGTLLRHEIHKTYIKSAKRFTYEEAKSVIDGKKKSKHKHTLLLMVELGLILKEKRNARGSVDFALPEVVLDIDAEGNPTSYHIVEYDITHQLVEEFMLKANEIVASSIDSRGLPLIFRVHEEPSQENKEAFFGFARSLGFFVPPNPSPADIQNIFTQAKATSFGEQLAISFIRSLKIANYSSANVGHFGLALEHYCHFTSPIRRYPDLLIHRLLFGEHIPEEELQSLAEHCSAKERVSFKAEQNVKLLKKLRLLNQWYEEDPKRVYPCLISKIRPFALNFELSPLGIEGSLHVSEIGGDYFIHEPFRNCFLGRHSHVRFCLGDKILMRIVGVDLITQEVSWVRSQKKVP